MPPSRARRAVDLWRLCEGGLAATWRRFSFLSSTHNGAGPTHLQAALAPPWRGEPDAAASSCLHGGERLHDVLARPNCPGAAKGHAV